MPAVPFPPLPPTANTLPPDDRAALVRSSRKLMKILGDVPRVPDQDDMLPPTQTAWHRRKPAHLPPLLRLSPADEPSSGYHRPPSRRGSVLSVLSNAPSTASSTSASDAPPGPSTSHRRAKLGRIRSKLGEEVPATAVFPSTPRTAMPPPPPSPTTTTTTSRPPLAPRSRTRSFSRRHHTAAHTDDARSITFSISSDESVHRVTFAAARVVHSPGRPHKTKHVYHTGALPPVPPIPAHLSSGSGSRRAAGEGDDDDDGQGLIRPRVRMGAGSRIGGADFKAARRAKREGRAHNGEPGEMIEMVGFHF